jgi:predicted TIM-barrel fold metal-dependent hydrolase
MNALNRRQFVATATSTALAIYGSHIANAAPASTPRVDTHLHCFAGNNDPRFPFHPRAPYTPDEPATPEHLLKCMDEAGVDFAVVVHPEPYQDDHRYLEHCLAVGGKRLKGTALFFSDRESSLEQLPDLAKRADLIAVRVHAYAPDRLPPFGKPELRRLWQMATDLGLAVQLHFEPRYAPGFEPLIREFRETRVIIDHLGRPFQGTPEEHAVVVNWSRYPNTIMKMASIPSNTSYPHRDIAPVIKQLTDNYGADRMIYGGGFGADATGETYRAAFERAASLLGHLTEAERAKILGGNAIRLFGFAA